MTFEEVSPIKNDVFPASHVSLLEASYHQESSFPRLKVSKSHSHVIRLVGSVTSRILKGHS